MRARANLSVMLAVFALAAAAQAAELPVKTTLLVVLKVLTYDSGFAARGKGDFVVLIPQQGDGAHANALLEATRTTGVKTILDRPLRFATVELDQLEAQARSVKASAILLPDGSPPATVKEVARIAAALRLYAVCLEEAPVKQGLLLGVAVNEGKPQVVINTGVARSQGIEFSTAVLRIARTYQ